MHYGTISINNTLFGWLGFYDISTHVCIYQPLYWVGCGTRLIFKWSLTGLNSEFYFFLTGCLNKPQEASLPYFFTCGWWENNWIHTISNGISAMWNAITFVLDLKSCPFATMITITPRYIHISTLVGYLMPNPVIYMICKRNVCR